MGQRPIENYTPSSDVEAALAAGDVDALLALHRTMFGGWKMEDEPEAEGGEDESDEDADEDESDDEEDPKPKAKGTSKIKELSDENAKRRNEVKRLSKERDDLAARVKAAEDAKLSDDEKVVKERDDLKASVESLKATNQKLALHNAFLQDGTQNWHNPKAALRLLDLDGVEIGEDGEVTGLDKAIATLAKENPYLLKSTEDDDETSGLPSTGSPPAKPKKNAAREALEKKYRLG